MTDPLDERLRGALRAEADTIHADGALLGRIRTATAPPSAWRRRTPMLAMAAAIAVIGGVATVLLTRDDGETVVAEESDRSEVPAGDLRELIVDVDRCQALDGSEPTIRALVFMEPAGIDPDSVEHGRAVVARLGELDVGRVLELGAQEVLGLLEHQYPDDPSVSGAKSAEVPSAYGASFSTPDDATAAMAMVADLPGVWATSVTDCRDHTGTNGQPPVQAVAVTQHGRVVVIDTRTGAVTRDLGGFDDPTDPAAASREGGAFAVTGVALHPNGRDVYIETCCEPAGGAVFRVPIDGSVLIGSELFDTGPGRQVVVQGYGIDISADGRWVAYVSGPVVGVMDLETGDVPYTVESGDSSAEWVQVAINADGSVIAIERALERGRDGEVIRSDVRTTSLADGTYEEHPTDAGRFMPLWLGPAGLGSAPAPGEVLRDVNVDPSGQWILVVTADGRLVARGDPMPSPIPGDGYLAADW